MRAILVAVDMSDFLKITLPYNRSHFSDVMVVTDSKCAEEVTSICHDSNASVYVTDLFYACNAKFNKWLALESGLTIFGRECTSPLDNWICLMDVDILWPKSLKVHTHPHRIDYETPTITSYQKINQLCTPLRHMMVDIPKVFTAKDIPEESEWKKFPIHRNVKEWAGYSQIFNTKDKHLPSTPPWHEVDWVHAGGADSFFQALWPRGLRIRPNFNVLHLGSSGENWLGRATDYLDGTQNTNRSKLQNDIRSLWSERRKREARSQDKDYIFYPEKIHEKLN